MITESKGIETGGLKKLRFFSSKTFSVVQKACKFFTLVELLIVIVVIVILFSMLLPALKTVRERGKGISCLNNQKQLGLQFFSYAGDYNEFLPPFYTPFDSSSNTHWPSIILRNNSQDMGGIFVCPSKSYNTDFFRSRAKSISESSPSSSSFKYPHYGYNRGLTNPIGDALYAVMLSKIKKTSTTILLADDYALGSLERGYYILLQYYQETGSYGLLDALHDNSVNVLWSDGHASGKHVNCAGNRTSYSTLNNPYCFEPFKNGNPSDGIDDSFNIN